MQINFSIVAFFAFCFLSLFVIYRKMDRITKFLSSMKESPADISYMVTRVVILLMVLVVVVGVIIMALNEIPIEGTVASLLFAVIGYAFGLFTSRNGRKH